MRRFPFLEILIVILVVLLVYLLGKPQYAAAERSANDYTVYSNMYTLKAAVENYAAYNTGAFPVSASQMQEYLSMLGKRITNPYTNEEIHFPNIIISPEGDTTVTEGDVIIFAYEFREEPKETNEDSKNGRMRGMPGGLAYGYYIPPGDSVARAYGIIGFDGDGRPIADRNPAGVIELRVLVNS
jgi:Tfp pilus assembly protein PilE